MFLLLALVDVDFSPSSCCFLWISYEGSNIMLLFWNVVWIVVVFFVHKIYIFLRMILLFSLPISISWSIWNRLDKTHLININAYVFSLYHYLFICSTKSNSNTFKSSLLVVSSIFNGAKVNLFYDLFFFGGSENVRKWIHYMVKIMI